MGSYAKAGSYIGIGKTKASSKAKISLYLNGGARLTGTPTATKIIDAWRRFLKENRQTSVLDEATRVLDPECREVRSIFNAALEARGASRAALLSAVENYSSILLAVGRPAGGSTRALIMMFRGLGALERGECEQADRLLNEALALSAVVPSIRDVVLHNSSYCKATLVRNALSCGNVVSAVEHAKSGMAQLRRIEERLGIEEEVCEAMMTFQVYLFVLGVERTDLRARAARQRVIDIYMRRYSLKDEQLAVDLWCQSHASDRDVDSLRKVFSDYDHWMTNQEDDKWYAER